MGNGDFISGLGLDLRAPRLQSYHSGFSGIGFDRILGMARMSFFLFSC